MYIVQYETITDGTPSIPDEWRFVTEDNARKFFNEWAEDLPSAYRTEYNCRTYKRSMEKVVFALGLYEYDEDTEEYSDALEYAEYSYEDFVNDTEN